MKKLEITIALILGSTIGILGMLGVVFALKLTNKPNTKATAQATPTEKPNISSFAILSPKDFTTWNNKTLTIKGSNTDSFALIASSDTADLWLSVPQSLEYLFTVTPKIGVNSITVFQTKRQAKKDVHILNLPEITSEKNYFEGIVTDITAEYIQVKRETGIEQIVTSKETKAISISKEIKSISMNEVAIGDTIYAVGDKVNNSLNAAYIIVANGDIDQTSTLHQGILKNFDKSTITIEKNEGGENETLKFDQTTKLIGVNTDDTSRGRTKFIKDDIGSEIYAVFVATDSAKPVRSIFIKPTQNK